MDSESDGMTFFGTHFADPFPHTVINNYLSADVVRQINAEWPTEFDTKEDGSFTRKWSTQGLPPAAKAVAHDEAALWMATQATGIEGLIADPDLCGAGLHCIPAGGFLKMHADFNAHPVHGWHRRVNMLVYLNEVWQEDWNGYLQLGLDNPKRIAPLSGRCVIFETNDESWHGHPEKLACPEDVQRRSLALYFYTPEPPTAKVHSTIYRKDKRAS